MTHSRPTAPRAAKFVAAIGLLGLGCNVALAAEAHVAYLPVTFHAESQTIRTTACLQVTERVTIGPGNDLLWTNSSYITVEDRVFKSDASYDSGKLKQPFSNLALR
jgi:hypothetical protein